MSDDLRQLQRRMEQATAAELSDDCPLDAETASLREAWGAFGQLIEAAEPSTETFSLPKRPRRLVRTRWSMAAAVLAAAAAVAIAVTWNGMRQPVDSPPLAGGFASPITERTLPKAEQIRVAAVESELPDLAWDDPLDEQIVQAGQAIVRVQQDWYHLDDAFEPLQNGLDQMAEDIDDNIL